jgi:DNA-binding MarR family transcriptional regulator
MAGKSLRRGNIETIRQDILAMHFSRLIAFSDVINRYLRLRTKDDTNSWLRVNAVLFIITRGGKLTPTQLAKLLLRSRNSVSKLIDGMEKDGLVRRYHTREDRRTVYVEVTSAGLSFIMARLNVIKSLEEEIRSCLDDGELQTIVDLTRKLRLKLIEKLTGLKS